MSKIVVAKLIRLGKDGDKFSKKLEAQVERTNVKIDDEYLETQNANWKTSGRIYVVDEKLTKERNELLNPKKKDVDPDLLAAQIKYKEVFDKKPNALMKIETLLTKIDEKLKTK